MESMFCLLYVLLNVCNLSFGQNDNCRVGTYGNNCQLNCPEQCRPLQIFACNKKTGRCAEGCNNGYYGDKCDKRCSCPSGICYQANGNCYGTDRITDQNTETTTNNSDTTPVYTNDDEGVAAGWRTSSIILIVFNMCLGFGGIWLFLYLRFKKQDITLTGSCKIRFSKAADANVSGDEENGTEQETLLMPKNSDVEATGGQDKTTNQHGDQSEETSQKFKQSPQVEDLKQQIKQLQEENKRLEGALSRYKYRENDIHSVMGLKQNKTNSTYYLMKKDSTWLYCPHLTFDKETVNVKVAQIDGNMVLWNTQDQNPQNIGTRFQHFQGTTLRQEAGRCKDHNKICLVSVKEGKKKDTGKEHLQELMNNVGGSETKVEIGIFLNKEMKQIGVYDCKQSKLLQKTDIKIDAGIRPMFGVYAGNEASVSVQLRAGRDIPMCREKKQRIRENM